MYLLALLRALPLADAAAYTVQFGNSSAHEGAHYCAPQAWPPRLHACDGYMFRVHGSRLGQQLQRHLLPSTFISLRSHSCSCLLTRVAMINSPISTLTMMTAASMGSRQLGTQPWWGATHKLHLRGEQWQCEVCKQRQHHVQW